MEANVLLGKILLWLYLIAWIALCIVLYIYWNDMPIYASWSLSLLAMFFAPDINGIKLLFGMKSSKEP